MKRERERKIVTRERVKRVNLLPFFPSPRGILRYWRDFAPGGETDTHSTCLSLTLLADELNWTDQISSRLVSSESTAAASRLFFFSREKEREKPGKKEGGGGVSSPVCCVWGTVRTTSISSALTSSCFTFFQLFTRLSWVWPMTTDKTRWTRQVWLGLAWLI